MQERICVSRVVRIFVGLLERGLMRNARARARVYIAIRHSWKQYFDDDIVGRNLQRHCTGNVRFFSSSANTIVLRSAEDPLCLSSSDRGPVTNVRYVVNKVPSLLRLPSCLLQLTCSSSHCPSSLSTCRGSGNDVRRARPTALIVLVCGLVEKLRYIVVLPHFISIITADAYLVRRSTK